MTQYRKSKEIWFHSSRKKRQKEKKIFIEDNGKSIEYETMLWPQFSINKKGEIEIKIVGSGEKPKEKYQKMYGEYKIDIKKMNLENFFNFLERLKNEGLHIEEMLILSNEKIIFSMMETHLAIHGLQPVVLLN